MIKKDLNALKMALSLWIVECFWVRSQLLQQLYTEYWKPLQTMFCMFCVNIWCIVSFVSTLLTPFYCEDKHLGIVYSIYWWLNCFEKLLSEHWFDWNKSVDKLVDIIEENELRIHKGIANGEFDKEDRHDPDEREDDEYGKLLLAVNYFHLF